MREEVSNWWKQAKKDLESAEKNLGIEEYYITAFLAQQSVEKSLKSLYIHKVREAPGPTHSLIYLGKKVGIPEEYHTMLRKLNPDFVITRYPDAANGIPYELYDKKIAVERLNIAKKIHKWIAIELKK
jgi:HEPN domain-containing protein